jgi:hypothetical protein
VYLFVWITKEMVQVRKATRVENAPRLQLRPPWLTREALPKFESDASELVLAILNDDGSVAEAFAWPAEPEAILDRAVEKKLTSSVLSLSEWAARWRIPMTQAARYLQFYRTDFARAQEGGSTFRQTSLGVFDLKPGGPERPAPRLPVPDPRAPVPVPLATPPAAGSRAAAALRRTAKRTSARKKKATKTTSAASAGGFITKSEALVDNGDPSTKFNIVILGDGFTAANVHVFNAHALLLKKALTTTKPFKSLAKRINVYKVTAMSVQSGISNCPNCGPAKLKNTYFQTTGCWNGTTSGTFVGTSATEKIYDAVETVIPQQYAHLVMTIVNCHHYGGSTPPELGLVFLPLTHSPGYTKKMFMQLATHESGHAIAKLVEEYNPCNKRDPLRTYPNEATEAELAAGTIAWTPLAHPSELDAGGQFKVIHRYGDPVTTDCEPHLPAAQLKSLGAFWGCHNADPPPTAAAPYVGRCDSRGQSFYRPMANCRMRNIDAEFCRVCSSLIGEQITSVSI